MKNFLRICVIGVGAWVTADALVGLLALVSYLFFEGRLIEGLGMWCYILGLPIGGALTYQFCRRQEISNNTRRFTGAILMAQLVLNNSLDWLSQAAPNSAPLIWAGLHIALAAAFFGFLARVR